MKFQLFFPIILIFCSSVSSAQKSTLEIVLAGKSCSENSEQTVECSYKVGDDLRITIAGVGLRDASITFEKSNDDGDFYGALGIMHGCVIVKRGEKGIDPKAGWGPGSMVDFAFISPKNGKVYSSWEQCKDGR